MELCSPVGRHRVSLGIIHQRSPHTIHGRMGILAIAILLRVTSFLHARRVFSVEGSAMVKDGNLLQFQLTPTVSARSSPTFITVPSS